MGRILSDQLGQKNWAKVLHDVNVTASVSTDHCIDCPILAYLEGLVAVSVRGPRQLVER